MSIGMFLGVKPAFLPEAEASANEFLKAINEVLLRAGHATYREPSTLPNPYIGARFGRSATDHCVADDLVALSGYCSPEAQCSQLDALAANPYRIAFMPMSFSRPIETTYTENIGGEETPIWIGSSPVLADELEIAAVALRVPLSAGRLDDEIAEKINAFEAFGDDDPCEPSHRIAWLMVYEGCRLSIASQVALSFAG
jgi:hypothetical protein